MKLPVNIDILITVPGWW